MADIKKTVLKSFRKLDEELDDKSQTVIQVVSFNGGAPMLIKQEYYKSNDEWLPGKLKGFTYKDLKFLKDPEKLELLLKKLKPKSE